MKYYYWNVECLATLLVAAALLHRAQINLARLGSTFPSFHPPTFQPFVSCYTNRLVIFCGKIAYRIWTNAPADEGFRWCGRIKNCTDQRIAFHSIPSKSVLEFVSFSNVVNASKKELHWNKKLGTCKCNTVSALQGNAVTEQVTEQKVKSAKEHNDFYQLQVVQRTECQKKNNRKEQTERESWRLCKGILIPYAVCLL